MICEACGEEFVPSLDNEDLCPNCMSSIREGGQEIVLGKHDAAIVLRSEDGTHWVKNIYIPNQEDPEAPVSDVTLAAVMLAMGIDNPQVVKMCQDLFYEGLEHIESADQAVAEDEASEESPDTEEQPSG